MKKKGFTLIELLAVIVILAVIAMIAVPTVLGIIEKAEKGALKNSSYSLIEAATLYYAQNGVVGTERFELSEENKLSYKGSVENGTLLINRKGKIMVCINDGNNAAYKNYSDTSVVVVSGKTCNVNGSETQVLLDGENTIDEYTNQELTELVDILQSKIDELETKISVLDLTKTDSTTIKNLSSQHTTDINRIDNSIALVNNKLLTIDNVYPVGSIYISASNTNPSNFIGGEWVRLKDRFLLGAGDTYTAGTTGGEATHTLTQKEMPAHNHQQQIVGNTINNELGTQNAAGLDGNIAWRLTNVIFWGSEYTSIAGESEAHNNMPPYITVYMWKRVK